MKRKRHQTCINSCGFRGKPLSQRRTLVVKFYDLLLVTLLLLYASGACAQTGWTSSFPRNRYAYKEENLTYSLSAEANEYKDKVWTESASGNISYVQEDKNIFGKKEVYFTGVMYVDASNKLYLRLGDIIKTPEQVFAKETAGLSKKGLVMLWGGKGKAVDGKVIWVDETCDTPGAEINKLKDVLNKQDPQLKKDLFPNTEFFTSNAENKHLTESLKAIELFKNGQMGELLTSMVNLITTTPIEPSALSYLQSAAKQVLDTYESGILISQDLNSDAYKAAKPFFEQMVKAKPLTGGDKDFVSSCEKAIKALDDDVNIQWLYKPENEYKAETYMSLKEIYDELKKTDLADTKLLLDKGGLLTSAFTIASSEMGQSDHTPDDQTCMKILELGLATILTLKAAKVDVEPFASQYSDLGKKIKKYYDHVVKNELVTEISLAKILDKKVLGETEFSELFGNDSNLAFSMIKEYTEDPKDPFKAIRVLIVEKFRRRFEEESNDKNISEVFISQIAKNPFFDLDSEILTKWKSIVDKIKVEELDPPPVEEKDKFDRYKESLKSIGELKVE
jgi:hypothetical protein